MSHGSQGTVDCHHLREYEADLASIPTHYPIASKLQCKVLFVDEKEKAVGMSCRADVVAGKLEPTYNVAFGEVLDDIKVLRVIGHMGVVASLPRGGFAFVPASYLTDDDDKDEKSSAPAGKEDKRKSKKAVEKKLFGAGTKHTGRCTGLNPMDNIALVSFRPSVISQPFLRSDDVKVGEIVEAAVIEVVPQGKIFVTFSIDEIYRWLFRSRCWALQLHSRLLPQTAYE